MDEKWDRRSHDQKIERLEGKLDEGLESFGDEIEKLKDAVTGGLSGEGGIKVRLAQLELDFQQVKVLVAAVAKTVHGDVLGRNSLVDLVKTAAADAEEAKKITQGRQRDQVERRGQNVNVWTQIIAGVAIILAGILPSIFLNWDKVQRWRGEEDPMEWAERLRRETVELQKTRGKEVRAKLREIERAARGR